MGNYFCFYTDNLIFERILDAEHQIYVGICRALPPVQKQEIGQRAQSLQQLNPKSAQRMVRSEDFGQVLPPVQLQVIRIGDYKQTYHRLLKCTETEHKLTYDFEHDITLILKRNEQAREQAIDIELFDLKRDIFVSKPVDSIVIKYFKKISFENVSEDLDKIYDLFHGTPTKT